MATPNHTPALILKAGRDKALLRRHPWVYSGAIGARVGDIAAGDSIAVLAADRRFLAWAIAGREGAGIAARAWSFHEAEPIDGALIRRRIDAAIGLRRALLPGLATLRLVNAESDGLPGVIVDRYGPLLVVQLTSSGADRWRAVLVDALRAATGIEQVYERSDADAMGIEGLPARSGWIGAAGSSCLDIEEHGLRFRVDVAGGQKTGLFLDQRDNRRMLRDLARGREVLDCFCYAGGFALNAVAGGARSVTAIDSSQDALAASRANAVLNGFAPAAVQWLQDDVFAHLRRLRDQARSFDCVVLDPPKFAPSSAHAERAARAYKDINLLALKLLRPNGLLMSFSCSSGVPRELFQKIVAGAAADARVDARVLAQLGPGADHPVALAFPEGDYLKGLLCAVGG